ncbi:MAG: hypothetical protein Q9159_002746 [Coniocarpon cinnabarinum]
MKGGRGFAVEKNDWDAQKNVGNGKRPLFKIFAQKNYELYGAPRLEQAKSYSLEEWEATIKPQLELGRLKVIELYHSSLGPQVDKVALIVEPYYSNVRDVAGKQYETVILPAYDSARPYAIQAYERGSRFTTEVGIPYGYWAATNTVTFFQRRVWPPIRILYGENVQPQLTKIRERLSNYRDSKSIEAVIDTDNEPLAAPHSSATSPSSSTKASDASAPTISNASEDLKSSTMSSTSSSLVKRSSTAAPENLLDDLQVWKNKFNRAAKEGAEGLQDRVAEICDRQISEQIQGTGEALVTSLEETAKFAIASLKSDVISIIDSLPTGVSDASRSSDASDAKDRARDAVRSAGTKIKDHAQKLRSWRRSYNEETQDLISSAADSTLDVVDSIREAGLQEIGMRWASMEGVTYKDWAEYHALRKSFDEWRDTLQNVVGAHDAPARAQKAAEEVESRGMAVAEDAAKELARLKEVANWKIDARDGSDDFSTRYTPPATARAAQQARGRAQEAVQGETPKGTAESIFSRAGDAAHSVAEAGDTAAHRARDRASSLVSPIRDAVSSASSEGSSATDSILSSSGSRKSSSASSKASSKASMIANSLKASSSDAASVGASAASDASNTVASSSSSASKSGASASSSASSRLSVESDSLGSQAESFQQPILAATESISSLSASGTTVPGDTGTDSTSLAATSLPIASVSASIASKISEAGDDYESVTKCLGESPVESMRSSVSAA